MKGVFIRGMKMPKSCLYCEFRKKIDQDNFRCEILGYPIDWRPCYIQERYTDCPLIEVEIDTDNNVGTTDVPDIDVGDMISRQQAINALEKWLHGLFGITEADGTATIFKTIRQLPPIQPKRGKWIEDKGQQTLMKNFIERGEVWRVCSVCGAGHMIGHKYECDKAYHETHHNFCPNCGSDMRKVTT